MRIKTSCSDNGLYPGFCYEASKKMDVFDSFKRNKIYMQVLEHVTGKQGQEYLDAILSNSGMKLTEKQWDCFLMNDSVGNPHKAHYMLSGKEVDCSPTTLRYIKVLSDIVTLFDVKKMQRVAEIGIGYAGQCRILMSYLPISLYTLFDLPEVLALAEVFLEKVPISNMNGREVRFVDGNHIYCKDSYDFCISNYAFSELIRSVQEMYLEKVICRSKAGYITWNPLSYQMFHGYSVNELLALLPGASIMEEKPLTGQDNKIIIWSR